MFISTGKIKYKKCKDYKHKTLLYSIQVKMMTCSHSCNPPNRSYITLPSNVSLMALLRYRQWDLTDVHVWSGNTDM